MADGEFHGWSHGENALYLAPMPDEAHVGLYLQLGRQSELAAVFMDAAMAQMTMDFLDGSLTATATANTELLRRLELEQPLSVRPEPPVDTGPLPAGVSPIEDDMDRYEP